HDGGHGVGEVVLGQGGDHLVLVVGGGQDVDVVRGADVGPVEGGCLRPAVRRDEGGVDVQHQRQRGDGEREGVRRIRQGVEVVRPLDNDVVAGTDDRAVERGGGALG